jgi:hypothetical protein
VGRVTATAAGAAAGLAAVTLWWRGEVEFF